MATNAAQRLMATSKSKVTAKSKQRKVNSATRVCAIELPKFRYVDDVTRFVEKMADEVNELDNLIKVHQKNLAYLRNPRDNVKAALVKAASFEFNVSDNSGTSRTHLKRTIDPELTKIVVPNVEKLKSQYGLSEDLYEKHRTLEAIETQLAMQFPDRRGEGYQAAADSIKALKEKVAGKLKEVLGFLNEVAAKHVPKTFQKYMQAVVQEVQEHVLFEDSNVFLYVSVSPEGELVFTYYLMLVNATNDEGQVTPHLYISIQWTVGQTTKVQVNHEYELPNQLLRSGGTAVGSAGEAVTAISRLLDLEEFATSLGTVPLSTQLKKAPNEITPGMFTYKDFVAKVDFDAEKITFKLRPGVTQEQVRDISTPLFLEVKQLFRNSRGVKLKMIPTTKSIVFQLHNVAQRGDVSTHDVEFLADKFGLNDSQLRKVLNILNEGER